MRLLATGVFFMTGLLPAPAAGAAGVSALDRDQLAAALREGPPCCVVDARKAGARALRPLKNAVVYRKAMTLDPTAAVVVIADDDEGALRVGEEIARTTNAPRVLAVKGGYPTWQAATAPAQTKTGTVYSFVIPSNTCEQGKPLQHLKSAPR